MPHFSPKVRLSIERENYWIKTVDDERELRGALRLRHAVFFQELLHRSETDGLDWDDYDFMCDHVVVIEKRTQAIVGTYRLNASTFSNHFYSEREFVMDDLFRQSGIKLELGRACVRQDQRTGRIIALLWKGILRYVQQLGARYVFGCSSIPTTDPQDVAQLCRYFQTRGYVAQEFNVAPRQSSFVNGFPYGEPTAYAAGEKLIPSLLMFYLKGGARVAACPAIDHSFRCADFMTILEMARATRSFVRYFERC